jgi:hypothetical protein
VKLQMNLELKHFEGCKTLKLVLEPQILSVCTK